MIAVDTNVVLRLILDDDEAQTRMARDLLARDKLLVSLTVLLEAGWVLESRLRMPRAEIATALTNLASLEGVEVSRADIVLPLLARYSAGADLGDMIHLASAAKCDAFATFDRRLARDAEADAPLAIETLA